MTGGQALAAPDKFRGSLTAVQAAAAICSGARAGGWECNAMPLADGGEGTLAAFGETNRTTVVRGPLGQPIRAEWLIAGGVAVIESASASGLALAGGAAGNDPVGATSRGTGELIAAAIAAGADRVIVAAGGSAMTDGGLGAVEALGWHRFEVPVEVACDVRTSFLDAATLFGPQKGASPEDVALLSDRLRALAERYRVELGVDVSELPGSGAAGGLAGGLAALGAELAAGFELVATRLELAAALRAAELVITGEGRLDASSFDGKVVGEVLALCARHGTPALVIAGEIAEGTHCPVPSVSLVARFGRERAWAAPTDCIAEAVAEFLR